MHTILAVITGTGIWAFITLHQLAVKYVFDVCIGQLPMPTEHSNSFYKWIFGVLNFTSANWARAKRGVTNGEKI